MIQSPGMRAPRGHEKDRALVIRAALLLGISTAFPIVASLMQQPLARWIGVADVVIAFLLALVGFTIVSRGPREFDASTVETTFRVYRGGALVPLVLIALFFVAGARINWMVLLIGLGWRAWLAAWVLPSALALWSGSASKPVQSA